MVLSKRERVVVIATAIAVGAFALDRLALAPLQEQLASTDKRRDALRIELNTAKGLVNGHRQMAAKWNGMVNSGMKSDPAGAESQVLHAMQDWSGKWGVALSLQKPERLSDKGQLPQIAFQAAGTGTTESLGRLLLELQMAPIPIKVTEIQINTRKEGTDDLSFQMRLSTVYAPSEAEAAKSPVTQSKQSGGR